MTNGESLLHELTALADSWERELAVSMAGRPLLPVGKFEVGLLREAVSALRGAAEPGATIGGHVSYCSKHGFTWDDKCDACTDAKANGGRVLQQVRT